LNFWHGFLPIYFGIDINTFLKKKYLAYLALLAGWIGFCYWLYAKELFPRYHGLQETTWPIHMQDLKFPLAFNWGSDIPLAGEGYKEWVDEVEKVDSVEEVLIIKGFYFRDEEGSILLGEALGRRRVDHILKSIEVSRDRIMVQMLPQEINADVRSNPFEAIGVERIALADVLQLSGDTIELCFPIKDSLNLPPLLLNRLDAWLSMQSDHIEGQSFIVGIADGSGIAESADMALERAIVIQKRLMNNGWKEDQINLSTGQRNNPLAIRNRCVIVYFE